MGAVDEEQVHVPRKEDVLNALHQVATKFRAQAGESRSTVKAHAIPLVEATPPSLEAWKLYSAAWNLGFSENTSGAVSLLRRAIQIDPNFAMAYAFLVRVYGDTGQPALAAESIRKAYQLRDRATDQERFFIERILREDRGGEPLRTPEPPWRGPALFRPETISSRSGIFPAN